MRNPLRVQRAFTEGHQARRLWRTPTPPAALPPGLDLAGCQRYCRDLTRREAKNFYWGFVALPKRQRIAVYALYGFAREVDDAVDLAPGAAGGDDPLAVHRLRLDRCLAGEADDPVMRVLADAVDHYAIPRDELQALIEGVAMDLRVTRYATWADFQQYCRLVASTVGRMCVRVFGYRDPAALDYAVDLGVAMQLANALRDVGEDFSRGRIYLPQEDLRRFDVGEPVLATRRSDAAWEALMAFEIERARALFDSGLRVTELIPRRAAACVLTMAGIYQAILEQLAEDPALPLTRRVSLSSRTKLSVMARSWLRAA